MSDTAPNPDPRPADPAAVPPILEMVGLPAAAPLTPAQRRFQTRIWSAFILFLCGIILGLGVYMTPSNKGIGTHVENFRRYGIAECGMYTRTGVPCPTCGCTTAVTYVAHGRWIKAFITQPFGAVFGITAVALFAFSAIGLVTGRWYGPQPFTIAWYWKPITIFFLAILAGGWVYKIVAVRYGI